jgi:hypothetical protein
MLAVCNYVTSVAVRLINLAVAMQWPMQFCHPVKSVHSPAGAVTSLQCVLSILQPSCSGHAVAHAVLPSSQKCTFSGSDITVYSFATLSNTVLYN